MNLFKRFTVSILLQLLLINNSIAQNNIEIISKVDFDFLKEMTKAIIDSSRIRPGQNISKSFGPNNTGITLIRPGGRDAYPAFWIRDYAMSVESGFISIDEQKQMLLLTAKTQSKSTWKTQKGGTVPVGSIADHIRIDDIKPIFFPGTYDENEQGDGRFGWTPPYCDQYYFIQMAFNNIYESRDKNILIEKINDIKLIDRLVLAFNVPPANKDNEIVYTEEKTRGVDFGFRDAIVITGDLCLASILKYNAAKQLSFCFIQLNDQIKANKYLEIAEKLKRSIPSIFQLKNGMMSASTGKSNQPDVWATALAVYSNILDDESASKASQALNQAYENGVLAYKGNIRHVPLSDDFNSHTMWEVSMAEKNTYQNGAYWGTPVGWVYAALLKTNPVNAFKLTSEYIKDLREHDFRKGGEAAAPYECFQIDGNTQNPLYMTSVACPYIVFRNLSKKSQHK